MLTAACVRKAHRLLLNGLAIDICQYRLIRKLRGGFVYEQLCYQGRSLGYSVCQNLKADEAPAHKDFNMENGACLLYRET